MSTTRPATARSRGDRRSRRFANLWRSMAESVDEQVRPAKSALFTGLPRTIVEIGPGCGTNFAYLEPGTRVVAFEPNGHFRDDLHRAAAEHGLDLDLRVGDLASGALADGSQDVVISSLVLCSVADIAATLAEIRRVLRPGGRLLFIEHIAAPRGSARARYQRIVRRPWMALGDGCDPCANTHDLLEQSGLVLTGTQVGVLGSALDPTSLTYWGTAHRPGAVAG